MCRIHLASRGRCAISPDRPTQGWTVTDKFFPDLNICRKFRRSLHLLAHQLPSLYSLQFAISERRRESILELVAVITRVFNVMDEEVLGLWMTNLMGRLILHSLIRFLLSGSIPEEKGRSCHIPSLHGRWSRCRQPRFGA